MKTYMLLRTILVAACVATTAYGLGPGDIAPGYFNDVDDANLPNGSEWSGLTTRVVQVAGNDVTRLYAVDGGGTIRFREMNTAGGNVRHTTLAGITDPEGLTHMGGDMFAIVDEATGTIYRFDIEDLFMGENNMGNLDSTPIVVTNLDTQDNKGIEGLAYDPASDSFLVLKERNAAGESQRGLYSIPNDGGDQTATFLFDPADDLGVANNWSLTGLFLTNDDYLYVIAERNNDTAGTVFRYKLRADYVFDPQVMQLADLVDNGDINDTNYEGIAVDPSGQAIYLVGDEVTEEFVVLELPVAAWDFDSDGEFTAGDIDQLFVGIDANDANFDLNNDGQVDSADADFYIEDFLYTYYADANLDREFNSADFVLVFIAGLYEDGDNDNAGWAQGDWTPPQGNAPTNFDFDTTDWVTAFQSPHYEMGPKL